MMEVSEYLFRTVSMYIALVSITCGCSILFLIYDMKKYTGFLWLVSTLTVVQMIYDMGFFLNKFALDQNNNMSLTMAYYFFSCFGGLATTFMTNAIALIVCNIAQTLRSYDIKKNYLKIVSVVFVLSIVPAITITATLNIWVVYSYGVLRILSILLNIGLCCYLFHRLKGMGLVWRASDSSDTMHPVAALSSRMILYPVVLIITRLGACWSEFGYETDASNVTDDHFKNPTPEFVAAQLLYSILAPSAGIAYFCVFLIMQPEAWDHMKMYVFCRVESSKNENIQPLLAPFLDAKGDNGVPSTPASNPDHGASQEWSAQRESVGTGNPLGGRAYSNMRSSKASAVDFPSVSHYSRGSDQSDYGDLAHLPTNLNLLDDEQLSRLVDRLADGDDVDLRWPENSIASSMGQSQSQQSLSQSHYSDASRFR